MSIPRGELIIYNLLRRAVSQVVPLADFPYSRTVLKTLICRLRRHLADGWRIVSVDGVGYRIEMGKASPNSDRIRRRIWI